MNRHLTRSLPLAAGLIGLALSVHGATTAPAAADHKAASTTPAKDAAAESSPEYSMGLSVGESMKKAGVTNVNFAVLAKGIQDGLAGKATSAEDRERINKYMTELRSAGAAKAKQAAAEFLAKNAKADGVVQTASGLQYKIVDAGKTGANSPQPTDTVTVQYRGKLLDGTVFDSSYDRGQPATFPVNGVIKGWQEALPLMKPGAKWQLFIPADLAYGDSGQGKIPPGSLLIFDVELLSVGDAK
jgi:FKBP-type peptidyl-prolyl cis-trans isomerase FklB